MKMISVADGAVRLIAMVAGCGDGTPTTMGTGPSATGADDGGHTATAATTDPRQLVTAEEASALTRASYSGTDPMFLV